MDGQPTFETTHAHQARLVGLSLFAFLVVVAVLVVVLATAVTRSLGGLDDATDQARLPAVGASAGSPGSD